MGIKIARIRRGKFFSLHRFYLENLMTEAAESQQREEKQWRLI